MLQLTPQSIVYVATKHVDFRKGIDGLIGVCRQKLELEPLSGSIFLFYNRTRTTIKIIAYDGQGFWLCMKRLSEGKFKYKLPTTSTTHQQICYRSLQIIINNGDPISAGLGKDWRSVLGSN